VKITHINTYDISGGAARAAYRLHTGLRELGQDSRMLVQQKDSTDESVTLFKPRRDIPDRLRRMIWRKFLAFSRKIISAQPVGASYFSDDRCEHGADLLRQLPQSDILHLHWIAGFLDYGDFFRRIPRELPVVWTLHDMNPFTGGCHFDAECGKYQKLCGACPQIGSLKEVDFSAASLARKKNAFASIGDRAMQIVAPSQWLAREVKRSSLLGRFPVRVIPYGVDTEHFQPRDRRPIRERYGIPQDANVALFLADWANEKRKGLDVLSEAIRGLDEDKNLYFLVMGRGATTQRLGQRVVMIEYVRDDVALSSVYSAANVLIVPSRQDNLPNTAIEALACGVPTIASATGGLPDIVRDGETGVLVPPGDVGALRTAISKVLQDSTRLVAMAESCRRTALAEYTLVMQAQRYLTLYESLLPAVAGPAKKVCAQ
jgi:glycosyltransferase involved in cell wall biosynthesis